jgi:hypothetical protein
MIPIGKTIITINISYDIVINFIVNMRDIKVAEYILHIGKGLHFIYKNNL